METKKTETQSNTTLEEWSGNFKDFASADEEITLECPIFIIFAEYFGYVSPFTKMAEDWCEGKVPEVHVQKFLKIEATCILRQMKKDYGVESMRNYYKDFYPLILEEYCEKLASLIVAND